MNSFFHFHPVPGPASAMLLPSCFSSHLYLQEQKTTTTKKTPLLLKSAEFKFPASPVSGCTACGCSLVLWDFQVPQMMKWAPYYLGLGWEIDTSSFSTSLHISNDKGQGISKFLGLRDSLASDYLQSILSKILAPAREKYRTSHSPPLPVWLHLPLAQSLVLWSSEIYIWLMNKCINEWMDGAPTNHLFQREGAGFLGFFQRGRKHNPVLTSSVYKMRWAWNTAEVSRCLTIK